MAEDQLFKTGNFKVVEGQKSANSGPSLISRNHPESTYDAAMRTRDNLMN